MADQDQTYTDQNEPDKEVKSTVPCMSASEIQKRWDEGLRKRQTIDNEAWENIAFIKGDHWAVWDPQLRRFVRPSGDDGRTRLRINLVKALWRSEVAVILESKPIPEAMPVTQEDADQAKARVANRILEHELHRMGWEDIKAEAINWQTSAGYAFFHVTWDKQANEVKIEVVPHFELVIDPQVRHSTREAQWVIHGRVLTKEEAEKRFNRQFETKKLFQPLNFHHIFNYQNSGKNNEVEGVQVIRMWHKPSPKYEKGFVKTIVNGETVDVKPWPFKHKDMPFVDIHHIRLPGRYEGQSMVADLIAPQKDYNAARSRLAELRALLTAPKILAPEGSLDEERISNTPGEVIKYRPQGPFRPEFTTGPSVPGFLFTEMQQAFQEMQDIASQHEVSRGIAPASGIPASGIAQLAEKDERRISVTIRQLEQAMSRIGTQILSLVQQFWDTKRVVRVWSEKTGEMSVELFGGQDVPEQFDVHIVPGSALPRSKAQLRQDLLALWDRRVITDARVVLKALDLPATSGVLEVFDIDTKQAKREHDRMAGEETFVAEMWHNHDVHIEEHNTFRKSEIYEQEWDDAKRAALADHVEEHEELRRQKAFEEAQEAFLQGGLAQGLAPQGEQSPIAEPGLGEEANIPGEAGVAPGAELV